MLVQADASQLEWRVAAELSKDPIALQEILDKADIHSLNEKAFNLPSRLIAKIYLFRTIFRGSGWSFANDSEFSHVNSSPKYWDKVNEAFYKKYTGLDKKHRKWAAAVIAGRPIEGPTGRFWSIEMGVHPRTQERFIPWTKLSNYPVQGTAADIMTVARISFHNRLKKLGLEKVVLLISSVHDSIVVDCPSQYLEQISKLFYEVFNDLPDNIYKLFGYKWEVPLGCEVKYGKDMKNMSKVHI